MKSLIRKILKEETNNKFIDKIIRYVKLPYFKNMEGLGLSENEIVLVLRKIFNQPVTIEGRYVYDEQGNDIYIENSYGNWQKKEYNAQGNEIYYKDSDGYWEKREYNPNGKETYYEDSDGNWYKHEYDEQGNLIYREHSGGNWEKYEYDEQGNRTYQENSNGYIKDNRR